MNGNEKYSAEARMFWERCFAASLPHAWKMAYAAAASAEMADAALVEWRRRFEVAAHPLQRKDGGQ